MSKIIEKIIEPVKIETGSIFKVKLKTIRYLTYEEILNLDYEKLKNFSYKELIGGLK